MHNVEGVSDRWWHNFLSMHYIDNESYHGVSETSSIIVKQKNGKKNIVFLQEVDSHCCRASKFGWGVSKELNYYHSDPLMKIFINFGNIGIFVKKSWKCCQNIFELARSHHR